MSQSSLIIAKIAFIVFIYVIAFGAGILPNIIPWCKKSTHVLGIANAFSGGVFLALAFMHILPEATSGYAEFMEDDHDEALNHGDDGDDDFFPLPFVLTFVGYAFILLIDKVIFDTHSLVGEHHHNHMDDPAEQQLTNKIKEHLKEQLLKKEYKDSDLECLKESDIMADEIKAYLSRNDKFAVRMSHALNHKDTKPRRNSHSYANGYQTLEKPTDHTGNGVANALEQNHINSSIQEVQSKNFKCNLTPIVLMLALSAHSVFEGIATGLVKDLGDLWTYIIAIGLHKWAAAMSLGISMSRSFKDDTKTYYICLCIFAFATPLGIAIGMGISNASDIVEIIFSTLAAGTFVYIACSEVIVEEFSVPKFKWFKMIAFLLGACLITCLNFLPNS